MTSPQCFPKVFQLLLLLCMSLGSASLYAQTANQFEQDWQAWVEEGVPDIDCPWMANSTDKSRAKQCLWPQQLALSLTANGLNFTYRFETFRDDTRVILPGDTQHWPERVQLNHRTASVLEQDGVPTLLVDKGEYRVTGQFRWQQQPSRLAIPNEVALVSLMRGAQPLTVNRRDGAVILGREQGELEAQKRNSLNVKVFRRLQDNVPVLMVTALKLSVSGKPREITLGQLLPADSQVTAIRTSLPARIEKNGDIRVQVRAGEFTLYVDSRFINNPTEITMHARTKHWPAEEYLSFEPNTDIRQVALSGALPVDTSLIDIPRSWRNLATYKITPEQPLTIKTEQRGDSQPLANQLEINRNLWLDFNGRGITALDRIDGRMYQNWRLNAEPGMAIGRATVAHNPVLITENAGQQGIEIRSPDVDLEAVSRIQNPKDFHAIGWQADVDGYRATLHLPPGWRVLTIDGVDYSHGSWLGQWNLWSIFLVLILVAASYKLLGLKVAVLAAVMLLVSYHEPGTPLWIWPALLFALALLPLVKGRWHKTFSVLGLVSAAAVVIVTVGFAIDNFRLAMYPSLERAHVGSYDRSASFASSSRMQNFADDEMRMEMMALPEDTLQRKAKPRPKPKPKAKAAPVQQTYDPYQLTENDRVQTGPGLPTWTWNSVDLRASGPVAANQSIQVFYSSPWMTRIWLVVSVLLVVAYALVVIRRLLALIKAGKTADPDEPQNGNLGQAGAAAVLAGVVLASAGFAPDIHAADYPPKYLLSELKERVTKAPECLPDCVSFNNGHLIADEKQIALHFDAYAAADIAVAIPTGSWQLNNVTVDGARAAVIQRPGDKLELKLTKGLHKIQMQAKPLADQVSINFPRAIHNFQATSDHWQVEGLIDQRIPNNTLNLTTKVDREAASENTLKPEPIESFVIVHRTLTLGQVWRLDTRVERLAPSTGAITVNVPLWENEQVLSDLHVANGKVTVQLGANQRSRTWRSSLTPVSELALTAHKHAHFMETWRIVPSSLWRISFNVHELPPVKEAGQASTLEPLWKPWPGETLKVAISRPEGIKGPVRTVEKAVLAYTAGKQLQKSELTLSIRASQGGVFEIGLPENAKVQSLVVGHKSLNVPNTPTVRVPLQPGLQQVSVIFQQAEELSWFSETPKITLPDDAANISVQYALPADRWALYLQGPPIGPAMLYWGVLLVIIIGAIALNMAARRLQLNLPVSLLDWLLLGIGLSTVNSYGIFFIAAFFFFCAWRHQRLVPDSLGRGAFNSVQVLMVAGAVVSALIMIAAIPMGLLSSPDMKVVGNGSYSSYFNYYQDRAASGEFPTAEVFSVPLMGYRIVMLLWALWLASRLLVWAQWIWQAFTEKAVWRPGEKKVKVARKGKGQVKGERAEETE